MANASGMRNFFTWISLDRSLAHPLAGPRRIDPKRALLSSSIGENYGLEAVVAAAARAALMQLSWVPAADPDDARVRLGSARLKDGHVGEGIGERVGPELAARALQREEDAAWAVAMAAADHQAAAARVA